MKPDEPVLLNRNMYDYETESEGVYLTKMKTLIAYMRSKKAKKYGIEHERLKHVKAAFNSLCDAVDVHLRARARATEREMLKEVRRSLRGKSMYSD